MTGRRDELLREALRYALAGWPVFPCTARLKVPAIPRAHPREHPCRGECGREGHGFHDATTNPDVIRTWWGRYPRANVGIATGAPGPDVLDVDARPDGNGWAALNRLKRAGLLTGARALVRTRSGGLHVYFAGTAQQCTSLRRHHLDFKADGGYILAPPSFVEADKNGPAGTYELLDHRPGTAAIDWAKVTALLEPPRPRRTTRAASPLPPGELPASVRRALEAPAEDRSAAMHRLIGACLRAGMDDQAIHDLAAAYEPAVSKYGDRLHDEVDRSLGRIGAAL